ncbi:MAG: DedA family protein [Solirubrobacterales bacterium]|nr:DedA family protein [Solirubrobacterales bacterium]
MLSSVSAQLGYPVLAALVFGESAGLPLPGETALLTAGGLVAAGHLALLAVILVAATAAIAGDTVGYWLGRRGGRAVLMRGGFLAEHRRHAVQRADHFFERYGTATVFFGRWIPGVRVVVAVVAGATRMPWKRFAVANALGAFAWAGTVATAASLLGPLGRPSSPWPGSLRPSSVRRWRGGGRVGSPSPPRRALPRDGDGRCP